MNPEYVFFLTDLDLFFPFAISGVYAFVVLKKDVNVQEEDMCRELNDMVSKKIAKYACPDCIQVILPCWV